MTNSMQQVQFRSYGTADVLQLIETPVPQPEANEVLIRVLAAGVNYSDLMRRRDDYFMPTPLPYVLGAEAAGEIVALGSAVDNPALQKGTRILAILPHGGGYAEYSKVPAAYCVPLPPNIDPKTATAIFVQGTTAYLMVEHLMKDLKEKTVLVHAGAGGVGSLLVQLIRQAGARVIATASNEDKLAFAKSIGADAAINYCQSDWPAQVIKANDGKKVDYILEMVGGDVFKHSFKCLATFGTMIVYGEASGQKGFIHSEHFVDESHQLSSFNLAHFIQHRMAHWQAALGAMIGLIAGGQIQIHTPHAFHLAKAAEAHRAIENRQTTGKVVLVP
ncbi:MAG: zinc-binding dehydrogenase [Bacteroidota bacterium]